MEVLLARQKKEEKKRTYLVERVQTGVRVEKRLLKVLKALAQLRPSVTLDPVTGQPTVSLAAAVTLTPESIEGLLDLVRATHRRRNRGS